MSFLKDMAAFMLARKKFWLLPALVLMTIFGGLIVLTKGSVSRRSSILCFDDRSWHLGVLS
jgi:hypothetical protein